MSTTHPETGEPLPTGIFFDPKRKRYRVRIYRRQTPVRTEYTRDFDEAKRLLDGQLRQKTTLVDRESSPTITPDEQMEMMRKRT